jgi:hypothetical protein
MTERERDELGYELYTAGERVPPGLYQAVDSGAVVDLGSDDVLPAALNGKVRCYRRIHTGTGRVAQGWPQPSG